MLKKLTSYCSESSVLKAVAYQAVSQNIWILMFFIIVDVLGEGDLSLLLTKKIVLCGWTWEFSSSSTF